MSKLTKLSIFFLTAALVLVLSGIALAQEEPAATPEGTETEDQPTDLIAPSPTTDVAETTGVVEELTLDETVTPEELGLKEPNLLPDSKFYFLKNWGRALKSAVTFNPVKKAELKLKFASEKLLEAQKLADKNKRPELLEKAAEKYRAEIEKLKQAADKIKEKASENPKVGKFLDKFVKQQVLHEKILDKLEEKVPEGALEKIQQVRESHLERFGEVMEKLEDKEQIKARLENNLKQIGGSEFKSFKNMEILKRIEEKAPEAIKEQIMEAREAVLEEFQEKITEMKPEAQEKLQQYIEKVKGAAEWKMEILEDVKQRIQEVKPEIKERLESVRERVTEKITEKIEEKKGIVCPVNMINPRACKGRIVTQRDENGCPIIRCVAVAEDKPTTSPTPSPAPDTEKPGGLEAIKPQQVCITLWDPVCGVDGKTYSNACRAEVAGVEIASKGACESQEEPSGKVAPQPLRELIKERVED